MDPDELADGGRYSTYSEALSNHVSMAAALLLGLVGASALDGLIRGSVLDVSAPPQDVATMVWAGLSGWSSAVLHLPFAIFAPLAPILFALLSLLISTSSVRVPGEEEWRTRNRLSGLVVLATSALLALWAFALPSALSSPRTTLIALLIGGATYFAVSLSATARCQFRFDRVEDLEPLYAEALADAELRRKDFDGISRRHPALRLTAMISASGLLAAVIGCVGAWAAPGNGSIPWWILATADSFLAALLIVSFTMLYIGGAVPRRLRVLALLPAWSVHVPTAFSSAALVAHPQFGIPTHSADEYLTTMATFSVAIFGLGALTCVAGNRRWFNQGRALSISPHGAILILQSRAAERQASAARARLDAARARRASSAPAAIPSQKRRFRRRTTR